jgi:hypothetical protein
VLDYTAAIGGNHPNEHAGEHGERDGRAREQESRLKTLNQTRQ